MSSWDKVLLAKENRLKTLMNSKYSIILSTLPDVFQSHHGYHTLCYKNFTAFSASLGHLKEIFQPEKRSTTRSNVPAIPTKSTGCLPALCIFCGEIRKKVKGKSENLGNSENVTAEKTIRNAAATLNDQALLLMIENYKFGDRPNFVAKEIKYHHSR